MERVIQTYDPGGASSSTAGTTINEKTINKILQRDIPIDVNHITDNTVGIPNQFANRLLSVLQKTVPKATLHRKMYKNGTIKVPGLEKDVSDILFDTGASHSSYISKSWVDDHRDELSAFIKPIKAAVTLGDNKTTVQISELLTLNLSFYFDNNSELVESEVTMCILDMPGKTIILGLPDIIQSYYYLFIEMVSNAKVEHHEAVRLKEDSEADYLRKLDLQLPVEGLERPYKPWKDTPWVIAEEELETPDPCSFTGPFAYLTMTHEEALDEYRTLLETHISKEFKEVVPKVMDLMTGGSTKDMDWYKDGTFGFRCIARHAKAHET